MSEFRQYIDQVLTPVKQEELRIKLGFTRYQFTQHMNNPQMWKADKLLILSEFLDVAWQELLQTYEVGANQLSFALSRA